MIYCLYNKKKRFITSVSLIIFVLMSLIGPYVKNVIKENFDVMFKDVKNIVIAEKVKNDSDVKDKEQIIQNAERGGSGRIRIWKYGIKFWLERPLLGYGPDNLESKYKEVWINQDRPHNLLIQLLTTSGIPGLITYITAIGIILLKGLKTLKIQNSLHIIVFSNVIAYLISAMFGNSMYYTSPYFFIFLGWLMFENINAKNIKE